MNLESIQINTRLDNNKHFDCIIIGGGPAGMSALIYLKRFNLNCLMIVSLTGGQTAVSGIIENYLGIININGIDLSNLFLKHCEILECNILNKYVNKITKNNNIFNIFVEDKIYFSKTILIATGSSYKLLNIPGENEFTNKGVSYCTTCDGYFFKNQKVVVIGGGNNALDSALTLSKLASKVTIINKNNIF